MNAGLSHLILEHDCYALAEGLRFLLIDTLGEYQSEITLNYWCLYICRVYLVALEMRCLLGYYYLQEYSSIKGFQTLTETHLLMCTVEKRITEGILVLHCKRHFRGVLQLLQKRNTHAKRHWKSWMLCFMFINVLYLCFDPWFAVI